MGKYYGIDISSNHGLPDWEKVRGVDFAILRITQRYGVDESFEYNYEECRKYNIKIGVYRYSYARDAAESKREAANVLSVLNGRHLDFPVFLDLEWPEQEKMPKSVIGEIIEAFRKEIIDSGYAFAIYTNKYWVNNILPDGSKDKYKFWLASVPSQDKDTGIIVESLRPDFGDGWQYSWKGTVPGIGYRDVDMDVFYSDFPGTKKEFKMTTAKDVLSKASKWLGLKESDGTYKRIIDVYNSHYPLARGYKVQYTDEWCDTFVSAVFISLNAVDLIGGTECGVEEHVKLFKAAGIWIEDGTITPKPGDIIVFNWDSSTQPNDGYSDHIGFVESIDDNVFSTIEGNCSNCVMRRFFSVGDGRIRGFARPKYEEPISIEEPIEIDCGEVETGEDKTEELPVLCKGITSPYVIKLQGCLNALNKCNLELDGEFGWITYNEVVAFQNAHGCEVDGVVGKVTWAAIKDALHDEIELCKGLLKQIEV